MLTISRLGHHSITYYNDTANQAKHAATKQRRRAAGSPSTTPKATPASPAGSSSATKTPSDRPPASSARPSTAVTPTPKTRRAWLDDGRAPNGASGRAFTEKSVHGFDLTFAAPKSVSLIRALTDDVAEKVLATAHTTAVRAAMEYLHRHAGYTRVHNPDTGNKDLQRLPGLVAIAYQHETSRCGDPHLHTHVIVPNRQPRSDGQLVSLDSKSLYHEAKAAGIIYQATLRHLLHAERGFEWTPSIRTPGWPRSPASTPAASQRGRNARRGYANGRATTSSSSTAHPPPRNSPLHKRPPAPPNPNRWHGQTSKRSGAPTHAACAWTATHTSRRAPNAAHTSAAHSIDRTSPRWPRTSTNPPSRAPTWSN